MPSKRSPPLPAPPGMRWRGIFLVPDFEFPPSGDGDAPTPPSGLDELKSQEVCGVCRQLLEAMETLEGAERTRALVEYGAFSSRMNDPNADREALRRVLRDSPLLRRLLAEEIGVERLDEQLRGSGTEEIV